MPVSLTPVPALRRHPLALSVLLLALAIAPLSRPGAQTVGQRSAVAAGLPTLGDGSAMSIAAERRLGDSIARQIYRDPDYLDDPVLSDYLQSIWLPLLGAARARGDVAPELGERLAWELMISRDKRVNAFALPGGYMGVNLGLLAVTERPEELASVLAHELSHVSQRHIARLVSRQDSMGPWVLGAMILGALAARANADVANAAIVGSQAVAAQSQLNFSRDMEREADRVGFGVLTGAGFDGQGFVDMFDKLQQGARLNDDGSFPYLRSHPLTSERMADMRTRLPMAGSAAPRMPPVSPVLSAAGTALAGEALALHALMSARARVLSENGTDRLQAWLQTGQSLAAAPGVRYAAALSALRLGQRDRALDLAQRLRTDVPASAQPAVDALLLEVLLTPAGAGSASPEAAAQAGLLARLRDQALASGSRAGLLLGAQAALVTGEAWTAETRLLDWVVQHPRDALAWQMLARAHQAQGHTLRSVRAEAEARVAQLDYAGAVDRFKAAQALPAALRAADPMELAIVDSRRREVEGLLRESLLEE